jgi:hypothetical protein
LIYPPDPGGIRAQSRINSGGQLAAYIIEVFQNPGPGPVNIGTVFKDDVDQRQAELREAAHDLGFGDGQHGGGERIGNLVLHHQGSLFRKFCRDYDLDIGKIRDSVNGKINRGIDAPGGDEEPDDDHQETVADAEVDEFGSHEKF